MAPLYNPDDVRPMWEELTQVGFRPVVTPAEVDDSLKADADKTTLLVVNSVCGCAAGACRPGVALALQHNRIPDKLVTVFAGVDTEATARAREYMRPVAPSSPLIALFQNGRPLHILERRHIEGATPLELANTLTKVFDRYCSRQGPSVPKEVFENLCFEERCGSVIGYDRGT